MVQDMDSHPHVLEKQLKLLHNKIALLENKNLEIEAELKKAKNSAEAANKAKTEFLANMRHDIRTSLSGIIGSSEILKTTSHDPITQEYAHNLVTSSRALQSLLDETLETVRASSGEAPVQKRKFNLIQLMQHIEALYKARAKEKRLKFTLHWDNALPHYLIGDKIRIHRIAMELIANALNFTHQGFVSVYVTLAQKEERQLIMKLIVRDSGIGIPKEKQQEIYVQFNRLIPAYPGIYKGTGLGLYLVKQFVDELEGEIYVESELQKGTTFTCLIPMQESLLNDEFGIDKEQITIPKSRKAPTTIIKNKQPHILIVEDNLIAQAVARAILTNLSCRVDVAATGLEALEYYEHTHYDLIFMDIGLGEGMDGYEVTQKIRRHKKINRYVPIIALTAHAVEESRQHCIDSGIDVVLTKPLTQAHAADILKTYLLSTRNQRVPATKNQFAFSTSNEELFQLTQFPLLDYQQALKNCGNNCMLLELLTLMITQELPADLEQMKRAFRKQNYDIVEQIAHKIKGGAVYVGAVRMQYACQYLERYWKTEAYELFDKLYQQALRVIEQTFTYIADWLKKAI